jgi:D-alanyl-D-alanine dipeptidase
MLLLAGFPASASNLPSGFVYLSEVDPTIRQDMRYAGSNNFTHRPVPGYNAGECVLMDQAAKALSRVQQAIARYDYGLVVFDCYRPKRAVASFMAWAASSGMRDPAHNPGVDRNRLVAEGYIAAKSGHSCGSTVDLALINLKTGKTLDFGTSFDFFDPKSFTDARGISDASRKNRLLLVSVMGAQHFANYAREWWHFRFTKEPFAGRLFDFPIQPRSKL